MKITTPQQFEILVSEMEENPAYAKGFRKGLTPPNFADFWNEVAGKLNPFGPPVRDGDGWRKVWKDFKFKVKKKLVNNKTEKRSKGGGTYKQIPLSPLEEAVSNLLQYDKQINLKASEVGFGDPEDANNLPIEEEETSNVTSEYEENAEVASSFLEINYDLPTVSTRNQSSTNTKSTEKERINLLKTQIQVQQEHCGHLNSIRVYLKDVSHYQKKRLEIEEERLKIYKRKTLKEEQLLDLEVAIKKKKLELMEKQLNSN